VAAAEARGLNEDPEMWVRTVEEAFGEIRSMRRKYYWLAQLIANAAIPSINTVMQRIVNLNGAPLLTQIEAQQSLEEKLGIVLPRIDKILRTLGTNCELIGLPAQNADLSEEILLQVQYFINCFFF